VPYLRRYSRTKLCDGAQMVTFLEIFCVLYFQRATCSTFRTCILNLHYLHGFRRINEDAYFQNHVQLLRHTVSDPQHSSISLTANSAITGGVLGTDKPGFRQCDVGRRGNQSTRWTAVCDECCCTARLFCTEVRPHHTAAPGPSLVTRATADRVQARCPCLPLHENCAMWQTWTLDGNFILLRRPS